MKQVIYVTGNPEKADNFSRHIGLEVRHHPAELDEIQTLDAAELVEHKARQAFQQLHEPVLVEDVTLTFDAWGGLPGPFVKFFVKDGQNSSLDKVCRMLDGFRDRNARASCTFGYFDGNDLQLFTGKIHGRIADKPRGSNGFGFDKIFIPDDSADMTAAELDEAGYDEYYTTVKPFDAVRKFLLDE